MGSSDPASATETFEVSILEFIRVQSVFNPWLESNRFVMRKP
jgi:hypothetical protein